MGPICTRNRTIKGWKGKAKGIEFLSVVDSVLVAIRMLSI
jgi:hypothetical protein